MRTQCATRPMRHRGIAKRYPGSSLEDTNPPQGGFCFLRLPDLAQPRIISAMTSALFPMLLGSDWDALDECVRRIHGDAPHLRARGEADVGGAANLAARLLRRILGLPRPGTRRPFEFSIKRNGHCESWQRDFSGSLMRSVLDRTGGLLRERLGPMAFLFELRRDGNAIDWKLRGTRFFGIPLPRWMSGDVLSRSGSRDGRYAFEVDVQMALIGTLVSYRGWLEIADA